MNTPQELERLMAEPKTDQELEDMLRYPEDWTPQALDAARAELQRRKNPPKEVASPPSSPADKSARRPERAPRTAKPSIFETGRPSGASPRGEGFFAGGLEPRMNIWKTSLGDGSKPHQRFQAVDPSSEQILGGCRLVQKIGVGGFGAVYKAHHLALNITVAVKVLVSRTPGVTAAVEERFLREARIAALLKHPNIVGVLNVGIEDGIHFIVMDFIGGHDLKWLLDQDGAVPSISAAIRMFSQVCQGLHYAHEHGVLHRDIKPGNILDASGVPKLADFGFAKFADDDLSLTLSGAVMGTPYYLSPEQARDAKNVDRRSDIYSLGCTFYHSVCGCVPFHGETLAQVLLAHQQKLVPDPRLARSEVPPGLAKIIMKMMAKNPADRFESVSEVHRQLEGLIT